MNTFYRYMLYACLIASNAPMPLISMEPSVDACSQLTDNELALIKSTRNNDPKAMRRYLEQGVNPNLVTDSMQSTLLHEACQVEDNTQEAIELLLQFGANPFLATRYGVYPLNTAISMQNLSAIKPLVECDIYKFAPSGITSFHLAAPTYNQKIKTFLLSIALLNNAKNPQVLKRGLLCLKRTAPAVYKLRYELILPYLEMHFSEKALLSLLQSKNVKTITLAQNILKNRACRLQKIVLINTLNMPTVYDIEKNSSNPTHLFNPEAIEPDLTAFLNAAQSNLIDQLPKNNIFRLAHEGNLAIPAKLNEVQKFKRKATQVAISALEQIFSVFNPKN